MNRSTMKQRLAKLEAVCVPPSRSITLFQNAGEDMDARIDAMIEAGEANDRDTFVIISWIGPANDAGCKSP